MRIGELADLAGVSAKTIRYYESIGVMAEPARTPSGYRDFGDEAVDRLGFVRAAQAVGLALGEIREILGYRDRGEVPCEHVVELIHRRATEIDEQIADLERMRTELHRLERRARSLAPEACRADDVCHLIPRSQSARPRNP